LYLSVSGWVPVCLGNEWWTWTQQRGPCRLLGTMLWSTDGFCRIEDQLCKSVRRLTPSEPRLRYQGLRQRGFCKVRERMGTHGRNSSYYDCSWICLGHHTSSKTYPLSKFRVYAI
jgi:hypothetical protein